MNSARSLLALTLTCLTLVLPQPGLAKSTKEAGGGILQDSLVELEVNRKVYDFQMPWNKSSGSVRKSGLILGGAEVLTTADGLSDQTLIRVQRGGRGAWSEAELIWVDYHANLAVVAVKDLAFLKGTKAAEWATKLSTGDEYQIHRWRSGNLEVRKAELNQFVITEAKLSFITPAQMELSSDITGVGWGEPVMMGTKVAGLVTSQTRNLGLATPAPFIRSILEARKKGTYRGLGYFDFVWQPTENPAVHRYLGVTGEPKGVVVIEGSKELGQTNLIKAKDLILQVDGFDIDTQGNYMDPMYGHLLLENLATRNRWAGDEVKIRVWRDGKALEIQYRLPQADFEKHLLPENLFDREPEYLVMGGLVFQPLTGQFLRSWGEDWKRRAPFRLVYYNNEPATENRPGLVVLSNVLPDIYNLGYQDTRLLVIDSVNGKKISRLADLAKAFQDPKEGFHRIEYMQGDSLRRMVLDATTAARATRRVMETYGIEEDRVIHEPKKIR
jgi:hypothetical protein